MRGVGVSPGIAHGPAYVITVSVPEPPEGATYAGAAHEETARAVAALGQVAGELEARGDRAGGEAREILKAQALMAEDPGLVAGITALIERRIAAHRAVFEAFVKYREMLCDVGGYLGERVAELDDIRDRVIAALTGQPMPGLPNRDQPYVLVAADLAPADTALLSKDAVIAFVTEQGGPTSHTAILARAMGVPAVVACAGATGIPPGAEVLVDGTSGEVRPQPVPTGPTRFVEEPGRAGGSGARQASFAGRSGPGRTQDGHPVPLLANIGGPGDLDAALAAGAEGVGLYRTEFLFLDRAEVPCEEEQERAYRAALDAFPGGRVIVRTLDSGADKPLSFVPPPPAEPNPALGERGLRMFRRYPEVMASQLGALSRAAVGAPAELLVMAPMVAVPAEAAWFAGQCRARGLAPVGVMIEIPAAALRARDIVPVVDFVSIGTNDLAQYAFAADRQSSALGTLQDPWHPALLDLVAMAASAASGAARPSGVCGEAAGDPALACVFAGLGVTTLSMAPAAMPAVRAGLAGHTLDECRLAARAARAETTPEHARAAARANLPGLAALGR